jgi:hypothetical protein
VSDHVDDDCFVEGNQEIEADRLSLDSLEGSLALKEDSETHDDHANKDTNVWSNLFKSDHSPERMQYFAPQKSGGKTIVCPPDDVVEEGINKWKASLVG